MSERRFVIKDVTDSMLSYEDSLQQVTESELKRRLDYIRSTGSDWMEYHGLINYLIHGEGKEDPVPRPDEWPHVQFPKKPQPDPWQEWVENCPEFVSDNPNIVPAMFLIEWRRDLKHWIKKMPRGK